jgi:sirohydrochlorin ferrochelatase
VGKSNHRQGHIEMLQKLESAYRSEGDHTTRFYISFLDDEPRPDAAVINALNDGASRIIVATVFLTVSNHTACGKSLIASLHTEERFNVKVEFTEPLWNSERLMLAFLDKVYANLGSTPKEKTAVALIGHGQPAEWDLEFPTLTEQENKFRNDIIELYCREGFKRENLGNAWMEFKEPKPYSLMERFAGNSVEKIFFFASSISADAIHSQSDIPELVHQYPFPQGIEVINLGAWNAHPLVIQAIKERIDGIKNSPGSKSLSESTK